MNGLSSAGASSMETNVVAALAPWWDTLIMMSYLVGLFLVVLSLFDLVKEGREGGGLKTAALGFFSGVFLLSLPAFMNMTAQTLFGTDAPSSLSYSSPAGSTYAAAVNLAVTVVMLVGVFGYIKSFILFRESAKDGSKFVLGIWHIIGATLAVNIVEFLKIIGVTVGGSMQTIISNVVG